MAPNARNSPKISSVDVISRGFQPDSITVNCMRFIHAIWSYNERWDFPRAGSSLFLPRFSGLMLELVSKELNHLAAILHVYAGGLKFMK